MGYSPREMMIIAASREIRDGEVVFVGMRLPLAAFGVAARTHAPNAIGLFENGLARFAPAVEPFDTMSDPPNIHGAAWATGMVQIMGRLHAGQVDVGFIGGAEVDRHGNVNTSYVGDPARPRVKLPGSGGAADIAATCGRLLVIMDHEPKRLVERVDFVTSPGWLDGGESRSAAGLDRGGVAAIITNLAILRPMGPDHGMGLASIHPGVSRQQAIDATGWPVAVAPDAGETPPPTEAELAALRAIDPEGFWR